MLAGRWIGPVLGRSSSWFVVMLLAGLVASARPDSVGAGEARAPRVPPGFIIERAASDSAVRFPMFATFDDQGRLFVAESSGLDLYAELRAGTRKCRVRALEDRDGDGWFETVRVFADRLVFPMGLAWRDGRLYVADPPELVALEDRDGDGRADRRTTILAGFGHLDNGSLHGLTFGPDGWLYMTMGSPDGYRLEAADGRRLEGKSGALIRCRPDGSGPEVVCRGFVNLVEAVFLPGGEAIGTDNWFQEPAGGYRDALVHLIEGGLYPYLPDEGTPYPITGVALPPLARYPAVALSGLERYGGTAFPAEYRGNLFSAQHNARRIGRHALIPEGSTFRAEDSDFVTSEDPDFHPSDVLMDADGSLLVVDTGAWYVQHCPTGRIRAATAHGGIFRVRWAAAPRLDDPRGRKLAWASLAVDRLVGLLSDPRPAVRDRAIRSLAARGREAITPLARHLRGPSGPIARVGAVWALAAIDDPAALPPLREALADPAVDVSAASARALGRRGDRGAAAELARRLADAPPRVRLAAAEALAHCGDSRCLPQVWSALAGRPDRFLKHALIFAAHHLADAATLAAALGHPDPRVQSAALLLLDQPPRPRGRLGPGPVVARLASPDETLRRTALQVLRRHPEWSEAALDRIRRDVADAHLSAERRAALTELILAFQDRVGVQGVIAEAAADATAPAERRAWALAAMARSRLAELPRPWVAALAAALQDPRPAVRRAGVSAAAVLQVSDLDARLRRLAEDAAEPVDLRLEALRAVMARHPEPSPAAFDLLIGQLGAADRPAAILAAGELLGRARLDDPRRLRLLEAVRGQLLISPATLRGAFTPPMGGTAAARWLDYIEESLRAGWRPPGADLRALLEAIPTLPAARRAALLRTQEQALQERRNRLADYEPLLVGGEPNRGRDLFFGAKAACATCHRIGEAGGRIGPDLTKVGAIRSGPDLLESILWPSSTFAQGFETYSVATRDGRVLSGLIAHQDAAVLVLRDASGAETRLPRGAIEELRRSETSLMPEGLARALSREELRDLLAFLKAQR